MKKLGLLCLAVACGSAGSSEFVGSDDALTVRRPGVDVDGSVVADSISSTLDATATADTTYSWDCAFETPEEVEGLVFRMTCGENSCHGVFPPLMKPGVSIAESLLNGESQACPGEPYVDRDNIDGSYIFWKFRIAPGLPQTSCPNGGPTLGDGHRYMPYDGRTLPESYKKCIRAYAEKLVR